VQLNINHVKIAFIVNHFAVILGAARVSSAACRLEFSSSHKHLCN